MTEQQSSYTGPVYNAQGQQIDPTTGEVIQGTAGPTIIINNTATATASAGGVDPFVSPKSKAAAFWLCLLGGEIGLHQFYVGNIGKGILYLCTGGLFLIGWFVDLIKIATGSFRDRDGRRLSK